MFADALTLRGNHSPAIAATTERMAEAPIAIAKPLLKA
jgi:hypothetical protein